ncbi:MAG: tRNA (cytidine(34)-2'-O)-methyltransferase [Tissierellia bacterium]|nr:tRNA (cytidine(34)-2'-O)-methyltransferase [Tissierellia bacterium]
MLNVVLLEPEIPHNTGAIGRTCALTNTKLHLIEPLGFSLEEKHLRRCGLDYWPLVNLEVHRDFSSFMEKYGQGRFFFATTKAKRLYDEPRYQDGDFIVFGKETKGLPEEILSAYEDNLIKIPMIPEIQRSLNLSNSCSIILYEALRQLTFPFLKR